MAPQKQHQSSHGRRTLQPNAKPKPPPLYRRGHSHSSVLSQSSHSSSGKSLLGGHKKSHTEIITSSEDEELGTASFLQFCATCEKQIVSPGSNILYCSEACREQDANSRLSHYERQLSSPAALTAARKPSSTYSEHHTPDILPRRSPTVLRPLSMTFSEISISENLADDDSPPADSDPFGYEGPRDAFWHSHDNSHHGDNDRDHDANGLFSTSYSMLRPGNRHTRNSSEALPSLSHTPSSSVGTAASVHSNWQGRVDTDSQLHQSQQQQQHHHHHHQSQSFSQHHRHHHHHHQQQQQQQQRQHQHNQHNFPNQKPSRRTNRSVDLVTPCFLHTSTEDKDNDEFRDEDTQSSTETLTMMKGSHRRQDSHQFLAVTASETNHQSERKRSGSNTGGQRREAGAGRKKV